MKMYQRTYREEQNIKLLLDLKYPGGYFYRVEVMDMSLDWMRYNCWVAFEEWFMHSLALHHNLHELVPV